MGGSTEPTAGVGWGASETAEQKLIARAALMPVMVLAGDKPSHDHVVTAQIQLDSRRA
jgi:hypothetical protein